MNRNSRLNKVSIKKFIVGFFITTFMGFVLFFVFIYFSVARVGELTPQIMKGLAKSFAGIDLNANKEIISNQIFDVLIKNQTNEITVQKLRNTEIQ